MTIRFFFPTYFQVFPIFKHIFPSTPVFSPHLRSQISECFTITGPYAMHLFGRVGGVQSFQSVLYLKQDTNLFSEIDAIDAISVGDAISVIISDRKVSGSNPGTAAGQCHYNLYSLFFVRLYKVVGTPLRPRGRLFAARVRTRHCLLFIIRGGHPCNG